MKYTVSLEIARPRNEVVELLADPQYLPHWLRGLVLHEPVNGQHGQVGTESRIILQMGQQHLEATEIVTRLEPGDLHNVSQQSVVYYEREITASGMWNAARERLIATDPQTTLLESENEYYFSNFFMRVVAPLMRGSFRKQSLEHMQDFKAFAEHGTDVREVS